MDTSWPDARLCVHAVVVQTAAKFEHMLSKHEHRLWTHCIGAQFDMKGSAHAVDMLRWVTA